MHNECTNDIVSARVSAPMIHSVIIPFRESAEDPNRDGSDDQGTTDGLQEDGILDLAEGWLLDPYLTIKDFADDVALLVLGDPWLIFVGICTTEAIDRRFGHIHRLSRNVVRLSEELPWSQMTMVHPVQDHTHALPGADQRGDSNHEADGGKNPPATTSVAESDEDSSDDAANDSANAKTTSE